MRCGVIYQDEVWSKGVYQTFLSEADRLGIEILNEESIRMVPYTAKDILLDDYTHSFQELINSGAKIVILIVYGHLPGTTLEILYDLGVRRGDMIFMGIEWLLTSLATKPPETEAVKRQELVYGAIQFFPA
jgi:ABC-type branched-subunit amino acid transport system substrate-binding protein